MREILNGAVLALIFFGAMSLVEARHNPETTAELIVGLFMLPGDLITQTDYHPRDLIASALDE